VAMISATAACLRPEVGRMVASTVIQSQCTSRSRTWKGSARGHPAATTRPRLGVDRMSRDLRH
jgi:hypothetical protein